jgi:hypothetical protein
VREELAADDPGVGFDGVAGVGGDDVPGQRIVLVQVTQQRREPGDLVRLGADEVLGQHGPGAVRGGGQQVRDQAVVPGRAAHGLAVDRDRGQRARAGQRERDGAGARAGGQVRAGLPGQGLRAERGQHPDDGVRVRRDEDPQRVPPGPGGGQHLPRGGMHPGGRVLQPGAPRQHRGRAQGQHARHRVPDPARAARIGDRGEALQQAPARRRPQRGGAGGKLAQGPSREGFRGGGGRGHARLDGQRDPRQGK